MSLHRRNPRRDAVEGAIVETLRAFGLGVVRHSDPGSPDLTVCSTVRCWLVEVKAPKGRFQPAQTKWLATWPGCPPVVLRSVEEALTFARGALLSREE